MCNIAVFALSCTAAVLNRQPDQPVLVPMPQKNAVWAVRGSLLETWLLMEYADRGSLSDALRSGRFPRRDFSAIYRCLLDIASGALPAPSPSVTQCSHKTPYLVQPRDAVVLPYPCRD